MPCYKPLEGYYARKVNKTGKRSLVFNVDQALVPVKVPVPCGQCCGCRLDRSLSWALRCMHEASLYSDNCFITLTFSDDNIKPSLEGSDFQLFLKRLRKFASTCVWDPGSRQYFSVPRKYWQKGKSRVRYFHCGEYGEKFSRPHHHAVIFGFDFEDKVLVTKSANGNIYSSKVLDELWGNGFTTIGDVTFESCAYVARYVLKKFSKENIEGTELYDGLVDVSRGKFYDGRKPEFVTMSLKPGIGQAWYDEFSSDIYPNGFCVVRGKRVKPPKFYDSQFELDNPSDFAMLKVHRIKRAENDLDNSRSRLAVRYEVKKACLSKLKRGYENGSQDV